MARDIAVGVNRKSKSSTEKICLQMKRPTRWLRCL